MKFKKIFKKRSFKKARFGVNKSSPQEDGHVKMKFARSCLINTDVGGAKASLAISWGSDQAHLDNNFMSFRGQGDFNTCANLFSEYRVYGMKVSISGGQFQLKQASVLGGAQGAGGFHFGSQIGERPQDPVERSVKLISQSPDYQTCSMSQTMTIWVPIANYNQSIGHPWLKTGTFVPSAQARQSLVVIPLFGQGNVVKHWGAIDVQWYIHFRGQGQAYNAERVPRPIFTPMTKEDFKLVLRRYIELKAKAIE